MDRHLTLIAALVVVATLSGCSALLDGGGTTPTAQPEGATPTVATPSVTATDASPAVTTTETPATAASTTPTAAEPTAAEPTVTPVPTRTFTAATVQDAHVDALRAAGSFQRSSALVIRNESTTRYINGSYAVETDGPMRNSANITYVTADGTRDFPVTTRYTDADTTWERRFEDNGTVYRKGTEPYNESDPEPVDERIAYRIGRIAFAVVDASAWSTTGNGTLEGSNVTRYDAGGDAFDAEGFPNARGNATLVVDETGVVRYVAYRFVATPDGERTEYVYEAGYTGVGNTTVERPDWTGNA